MQGRLGRRSVSAFVTSLAAIGVATHSTGCSALLHHAAPGCTRHGWLPRPRRRSCVGLPLSWARAALALLPARRFMPGPASRTTEDVAYGFFVGGLPVSRAGGALCAVTSTQPAGALAEHAEVAATLMRAPPPFRPPASFRPRSAR